MVLVILLDSSVNILSLKEKKVLIIIQDECVPSLAALSLDNKPLLAVGTTNGYIKIWNLERRRIEASVKGHTDQILSLRFIEKNSIFVSSSFDNSIKVMFFLILGLEHRRI